MTLRVRANPVVVVAAPYWLFRAVPVAWSSTLTPEQALAALARASSRDGPLDIGHDDARVRIRGERVHIRWCARGEHYHCVLDARVRSVPGGSALEGCFRLPRMFLVMAAFLALLTAAWALVIVGSIVDYGPRAIPGAALPGLFWLVLLPVLFYVRSRIVAEVRSINSFVRRVLGALPTSHSAP